MKISLGYKSLIGVAATVLSLGSVAVLAGDDMVPIGRAINSVPIFDAHLHYKQAAWEPFPPAQPSTHVSKNWGIDILPIFFGLYFENKRHMVHRCMLI